MDTTELQELKRRLSSAADFLARNSQETGARAVRAAIPMVVANEVDEQSAVDAIKYLTNLLPWVQNQGGGMSTTAPKLAQAIDVLRALAAIRGRQQYNHILDANKLLNDKCERLMAEVKRLEYVAGDRPGCVSTLLGDNLLGGISGGLFCSVGCHEDNVSRACGGHRDDREANQLADHRVEFSHPRRLSCHFGLRHQLELGTTGGASARIRKILPGRGV